MYLCSVVLSEIRPKVVVGISSSIGGSGSGSVSTLCGHLSALIVGKHLLLLLERKQHKHC